MATKGPYVLDVHRMHDGVYCTLVLPRYSNEAIARAYGDTAREATRAAVAIARQRIAEAAA